MTNLFTFPEKDEAINQWIEEILVSPDFGATVSQMSSFKPDHLVDQTEAIDGDQFARLSQSGLAELSVGQCRWLLRHPEKLVALNEQIFEVGSPYWLGKLQTSPGDEQFLKQMQGLLSPSDAKGAEIGVTQSVPETINRRGFLQSNATRLFAIAATILGVMIGIPVYQAFTSGGDANAWGWQTQQFAQNATREEYLESLDGSLLEWYDISKGTKELLVKRIDQFSEGCDRLINASHTALPSDDRDWLLEKCKAWKDDIDQLAQRARDSDQGQLAALRQDVDDLVSKISLALQNRQSQA